MAAWPNTVVPSQTSSVGIKPKTRKVAFGDGYTQRSVDGLNPMPRTYTLSWKAIYATDWFTMEAFLELCSGVTNFSWTPPDEDTALNFTCEDWSWVYGEYNLVDAKATFMQVFEAASA